MNVVNALRRWWKYRVAKWHLKDDSYWTPFTMSLIDELEVGDYIMVEKLTDTVDMIALSMRIGHIDKAGERRLWRVKKFYTDGDTRTGALMKQGNNAGALEYFGWDEKDPDNNICHVEGGAFRMPFDMAVFYHKEVQDG